MTTRFLITLTGLALAAAGAPYDARSDARSPEPVGSESEQSVVTGKSGTADDAPGSPSLPSTGAEVDLDRLLKLPSSMSFNAERRQGATADEWRARFRASRKAILEAKGAVERTRAELDELAGSGGTGNWQIAPPGSNQTENQPMSFKLREELRRGREVLKESERRQRALIVEADLAGVPENWRHGS